MLFFNLANLEQAAGGDSVKFVYLLQLHMRGITMPSRKLKYQPSKLSLKGHSFLINPDYVVYNKNIDINYIVQYIKLAAKRDYTLYKYNGLTSLLLSYYPDIKMDNIKSNPLLNITQTEIQFKYEQET